MAKVPEVDVRSREYDNMQSALGLDPDSLESGKSYRWVNRSAVKVARAKIKGYRLCEAGSGITPLIEVENMANGTIVAGDLVLMETDTAALKGRKAREVDLAIQRTKRAGEDVVKKGKSLGIKTRVITDDDDDDED